MFRDRRRLPFIINRGPIIIRERPFFVRRFARRRRPFTCLPGCLTSMLACVVLLFALLIFMAYSIHILW
jgi:hypothetical protein